MTNAQAVSAWEDEERPAPRRSTTRTRSIEVAVRMRASKRYQYMVAAAVLFATFVDILGTAVIMPGLASVCAYAEGGPVDQITHAMRVAGAPQVAIDAELEKLTSPHAFKGEKGTWSGAPPFKFSMAMNVVLSIGQLASAAGSFLFGRMIDKVGCRIPMQICLAMGLIGYIVIYASAMWAKSYYLFLLGNVWNNFFGVCMDIGFTYFGKIFEGEERDNYQQLVLSMGLIGGTVGSFMVMPFSLNPKNGANYFHAIWPAMGFTVIGFVLVTALMAPTEQGGDEKEQDVDPALRTTPPRARRLLAIVIVASALDSGGDEGTRMARGTILSNLFPEWSTTERQNYLLLAMILVIMLSMAVMTALKRCLNLASICTIGCLFTLATQLALMAELVEGPFIAIWSIGKMFGFLSTIASGFIISELSPKAQLGYWNGINQACTNISMAVAPMIFSSVYDAVGNVHGQEMLACTSVVSLLATFAYVPLIPMMPKPDSDATLQLQDISYYEALSDGEFADLPFHVVDLVTNKMIEAGKNPRVVTWGSYAGERSKLHDLHARAAKDFEYFSDSTIKLLSDREKLAKEQKAFAQLVQMMPKVDRDLAKAEMGAWLADYFDDAGYINWETSAPIYKAMVMAAFPPLGPLNGEKKEFHNLKLEDFEHTMTKVLHVMDSHLASEQRRIRALSSSSMGSVVRFRR